MVHCTRRATRCKTGLTRVAVAVAVARIPPELELTMAVTLRSGTVVAVAAHTFM